MPIAALPPSTAQAIGSTSILPDPCGVVKELIDNGLDASATSISVEISQNTLDVIQVKDNGHGIAPADFEYVCKRAYTSKIQTLDDLRNLGGQSLGFRGVALSSAADMAESLTITTRTKDEIVASVLKYDRMGQLVSTEKASPAVGTSVSLTGFLKNIPVRRQTAVKNASKTIIKVKKLLQAYAIARPGTRLSFKVLNSKNNKDNWTYAPSSTANVSDASRKVAGVEIAGQCVCKSWPEDPDEEPNASVKLLAYLPKADADFSKIGNSTQYISVDGRPLSSTRGTTKEIIRLYKSYIRSAAKSSGTTTLSEPFICLQISCPRGSYDANVEPAKDDVLFAERDELIKLAEDLFKATYGEPERESEVANKTSTSANDFGLLLRQPAAHEPASPPTTNRHPIVTNSSRPSRDVAETPQANIRTSTQDDEILLDAGNDEEASDDNSINPWSIAKTHFFTRSSNTSRESQFVTPTRRSFGRPTAGRRAEATQSSPPNIPSPYSQQSSPEDSHSFTHRPGSTSSRCPRSTNSFTRASRERDRERYGNGSLDTWFMRNTGPTLSNSLGIEQSADQFETESVMLDDFDTDEDVEQSPRTVNKPFKVPLPHERRGSSSTSRQPLQSPTAEPVNDQSTDKRQEFPVMEEWSMRLHQASPICEESETPNSQDTERALDFERRKREANLAHRQQLQNRQQYLNTPASSQTTTKSPHNNRYLAARAALSQHAQQKQPTIIHQKTPPSSTDVVSMKENDPRAYLMRHQSELQKETSTSRTNNGTAKPTKRIPTSRLPLEKIPNGFDSHSLGLTFNMPSPLDHLAKQCKHIAEVDFYISGTNEAADMTNCHTFNPLHNPDLFKMCKVWETTITGLIKKKYRQKEVNLYDAAGGSDDALLENLDIYAAIKSKPSS